ncbi:uncharacterized protein LOC143365854 isoform X2 [Halictus rubicundus]|uniref:uncharacterized protein LOC143365854 isoform X2 n=1 Tax=Halictus rubicundus TaxID=77578 RepID=UPI004035499F
MRCFKNFFQHTWHPQQMDSLSRFELTTTETTGKEETELSEVKTTLPTNNVATSTGKFQHAQQMQQAQPGSIPCRNRGCKNLSGRSESRLESPWHFLKTVFLISMIVALVLWVIVYTFLAQYRIL